MMRKLFFSAFFIYLLVNNLLAYKFYTSAPDKSCDTYSCGSAASVVKTEKYIPKDGDEVEVINVDDFDERCMNHMNESALTGYCSGFRYVYNPYKDISKRKNILTACMRCAQCIAIANEVNQLFSGIIREDTHLEPMHSKETINQRFSGEFCKSTFTSYDFRNCNDVPKFVKIGTCGTHIRTDFDGQWPEMLKNLCILFVQQLDDKGKYNFFHQYRTKRITTEDFLCRGHGVFRECKNLNISEAIRECNCQTKTFWETCFD